MQNSRKFVVNSGNVIFIAPDYTRVPCTVKMSTTWKVFADNPTSPRISAVSTLNFLKQLSEL